MSEKGRPLVDRYTAVMVLLVGVGYTALAWYAALSGGIPQPRAAAAGPVLLVVGLSLLFAPRLMIWVENPAPRLLAALAVCAAAIGLAGLNDWLLSQAR